jgi:hypothetical protein
MPKAPSDQAASGKLCDGVGRSTFRTVARTLSGLRGEHVWPHVAKVGPRCPDSCCTVPEASQEDRLRAPGSWPMPGPADRASTPLRHHTGVHPAGLLERQFAVGIRVVDHGNTSAPAIDQQARASCACAGAATGSRHRRHQGGRTQPAPSAAPLPSIV